MEYKTYESSPENNLIQVRINNETDIFDQKILLKLDWFKKKYSNVWNNENNDYDNQNNILSKFF